MERIEGGPSAESRFNRWGFESHLQEYALLVARKGKDGLESIGNFPERIDISDEWHETLNRMRALSLSDGLERAAAIGFKHDMRKLHLSTDFIVGAKHTVQAEKF